MNDFERAVARMVRDLPAEQILALVRGRLVELGVLERPRPTEALRRELARRRGTPRRRRLLPSLELEAPEVPRVLFSHDPVFGLPILVPPAGSPAGDAAPAPPAPVPLSPPTSEDAVAAANAVMVPADPPTPADSEVRLKRVHRVEVMQALVKRAAVEIVEAKRPTVVACEWCGKLVAVKPRGPIARHCRAPASCSWRAHDAKFKASVDARRVELRLAPPITTRVPPAPSPSPPPLGVEPPPRLPPAAVSGAATSTTPDPRGRAPQDGQRKTGAVPARAAGPVATDSRAPRNVLRLVALRAGPGERRDDCRRYSDCLAAFVRGRVESHAHCPDSCPGYQPIPRHAELALASMGGASALATASETRRESASKGRMARGQVRGRAADVRYGPDPDEENHDETG